ncbi:MAG: bacillithiol system redox-active protein YtxJ [Bacteroidota bacterium]
MGFLDRILSAQQEDLLGDWKVLNDLSQLDQLVTDSHNKPVVLFKHSIRCGTSSMMKHQLEGNWNFDAQDLDFYYLDLINYRAISNEIADRFGVVHQSPQIIVLKEGKAIYDTSHHMISVEGIRSAIS